MGKAKWIVVAGLVTVGTIWGVSVIAEGSGGHRGFGGHGGFGGMPMEFSQLDTDGDGVVTVAEMKAAETARFQKMDTNNDGAVNADELSAMAMERMQERMDKGFARMLEWRDADGDGALSQEEMGSDRAQKMFARADADGDGQVSEAEFDEARSHGPRGRGHGQGRNGG